MYVIKLDIENLLRKNGKTKYWLCKETNITSRNLNKIINCETSSISFKYIEEFCRVLNCTPNDLIKITKDDK